ncbi:MAG: LacI family transcriptional regulator [Porticoccaceae bacterium]|nr:LacI family transcriptional regulator [Porticoccaceae bacterium]
MSTIRKVSQVAGVSTATVSRTLKNPEKVSPKTIKLVMDAVEKTGYVPNLLARNLSTGRSHMVVVLVPDISNPFFSKVIQGIEQTAQENGYSVLLGDTQGQQEREQKYANMVLANQADGLIQLDCSYPFADKDKERAARIHMVNACERIARNVDFPVIELDNKGAAKAITEHLIELGHERIAIITGPLFRPIVKDRLAGYKLALKQAGIGFDKALVGQGDFSFDSGFDACRALLEPARQCTAVFSMNDEMAIGAIKAAKSLGLSVPQDLSVAGFDNISFASFSDPPLTTVRQSAQDIGACAMNSLIALIKGDKEGKKLIKMPFEMVLRQSTAVLRRAG